MTTQKPIDFTKPIRTRDGRAVEILTTKARGLYPVIGNVEGEKGTDSWKVDGSTYHSDAPAPIDLVNVPQKYRVWANCYRPIGIDGDTLEGATLRAHDSRKSADVFKGHDRVACIEIEFAEGQGL